MDRRSKIIVSIVGIFIVLLALVGITYGYFLTQILGNTNTNSISITTTNLRLVYDDGTTEILVKNNIIPDTTVATKDFTVTNEGDSDISEYQVYLENVINDFTRTQDVKLKVTCTYKKKDNSTGTCNGYDSTYPITNTKLISNAIAQGEVHTYALSVVYEETNTDQSVDMGKTLQGKVQIYDPKDVISMTGTVNVTNPVSKAVYFVELQSEPITSEVVNGNYTITGVTPGNHTLFVKYRLNGTTTTVASKAIRVSKGTEASVSANGTNIVMTDKSDTAKINIGISGTTVTLTGISVKEYNPFNETSLAYQIYQNKAVIQKYTKDGTTYTNNGTETNKTIKQLTTVTGIADGTNIEDNGLFSAQDDYGTSYIYRGSIINNYVDFAGFTWRIVRINGDGSVRLILDGTLDKVKQRLENGTTASNYAGSASAFNSSWDDNAYIGYTYGQTGVTTGTDTKTAYDLTHEYTGDKNSDDKTGQSTIKQAVETFYKTYLYDNYHGYISDTLFCGDKSLADESIGESNTAKGYGTNKTYYATTERLYYSSGTTTITEATPTLKCVTDNTTLTESQKAYSRYTVSGEDLKGLKTNDDLIYPIALLSADELVMSGAFKSTTNNQYYLYNSSTLFTYWWTMVPYDFCGFFANEVDCAASYYSFGNGSIGVRPVINLSYDMALYDEGTGTSDRPYTVKLSET